MQISINAKTEIPKIIILVVYIVLSFIWRRKKETKFTTGNTLILSICIMIASTLQINTYLRDEESPRMVLLRYGFKTANKYLPFGSGFATYGSDMAARYYSEIAVIKKGTIGLIKTVSFSKTVLFI